MNFLSPPCLGHYFEQNSQGHFYFSYFLYTFFFNLKYIQKKYSFEASDLTKTILKTRFLFEFSTFLVWMLYTCCLNFVWMLYYKNWHSYSNPSEKNSECSREAKIGSARPTWSIGMRQFKGVWTARPTWSIGIHQFKGAWQENCCSCSYQTYLLLNKSLYLLTKKCRKK